MRLGRAQAFLVIDSLCEEAGSGVHACFVLESLKTYSAILSSILANPKERTFSRHIMQTAAKYRAIVSLS